MQGREFEDVNKQWRQAVFTKLAQCASFWANSDKQHSVDMAI